MIMRRLERSGASSSCRMPCQIVGTPAAIVTFSLAISPAMSSGAIRGPGKTSAAPDSTDVFGTTSDLYLGGGLIQNTVQIGSEVGRWGQKVGHLDRIRGAVHVLSTDGRTNLSIDDSADTVARVATLADGSLTGLSPAPIF